MRALQEERESRRSRREERRLLKLQAVSAQLKGMPVKQLCARAQELCVPTAEWEAARDGMDPKADLELLVHSAMQVCRGLHSDL